MVWDQEALGPSEPLQRKSLKDQIYHELRRRIILGEIPQGTRLLEPALAQMLETSITPVREALNKLAGADLVISMGRSGTYVRNLSDVDIENLYELREALERLAVRQSVGKFEVDELERMQALGVEFFKTVRREEFVARNHANTRFHMFFITKSGNRWLKESMANLNDLLTLARSGLERSGYRPPDSRSEVDDHQAILDAVRKHDVAGAEDAMGRHIQRGKRYILDYLAQRSGRSE